MKWQHLLAAGAAFALTACASIPSTATGVSVSGVNYTGDEMTFVAKDPANPANGAGEVIGAYSAGGVMCCYELPKTWRPGIKVNVKFYDIKGAVTRDVVTDVLPYVDGKPGQLWIASYPDGSVEAVSSEYVPAHAKWPGKIKGWPVPSLEFRRQLWEQKMKLARGDVKVYEFLLKELASDPKKNLRDAWEGENEKTRRGLGEFTGPDDPAYAIYLKKDYEEGLIRTRERVQQMEKSKP